MYRFDVILMVAFAIVTHPFFPSPSRFPQEALDTKNVLAFLPVRQAGAQRGFDSAQLQKLSTVIRATKEFRSYSSWETRAGYQLGSAGRIEEKGYSLFLRRPKHHSKWGKDL